MTITLPKTDTIDAATLRHMLETDPDVRVLDVRTGGEFETVHIPGSYNVPLDTLTEHVRDLADIHHPVVLICQSGGRASQAHEKLTGQGKDRLHILDGGMNSWQAAGGEVVHGDSSRWAMDRQVRGLAGAIALAGVVASVAAPRAKWLSGGVAAGLLFSAVTNTCAMAAVLAKLPYNRTDRCDIAGVLDQISAKAA